MKYKIRYFLLPVLLLAVALCLSACGKGAEPSAAETTAATTVTTTAHTHSYGEWTVTLAPTCTQEGTQTRSCACGESETQILEITKHTLVVDASYPPTCTEEGRTTGTHCSVCQAVVTEQQVIPARGHTEVKDPAREPTCSSEGLSDGSHCLICHEIVVEQTVIAPLPHTPVVDPAIPATCTSEGRTEGSHCSVCLRLITPQTKVEKLPHTPVSDVAVAPTCSSEGRTGGSHCSVCHCVVTPQTKVEKLAHTIDGNKCLQCTYRVINYADPKLCSYTYGYDFLATLEKGQAMQELYRQFCDVAYRFHSDPAADAEPRSEKLARISDLFYYGKLGLTDEDADLVYRCFKLDTPMLYWVGGYEYNAKNDLMRLRVDIDYAKGAVRAEYNLLLCDAIEEYAAMAEGKTSAYEIALIYHDAIIQAIDYAYKEDGVTPEDARWAHNIVGFFTKQGVVCEGYAEAFQVLLNLNHVENLYVNGSSPGGRHAWNLVRLDDGEWYWYDLTWDDIAERYDGVKYQYFCVNDTQYVDWYDIRTGKNSPTTGKQSFLDSHTPIDNATSVRPYSLPARSDTVFDGENVLEIGETFTVDGMTFARWSADAVSLVSAPAQSTVTVPETVEYGGRSYSVVMLAHVDETGHFGTEAVISDPAVTEIILPGTIRRIGYRTLYHCYNLRDIHFQGTLAEWEALPKGKEWDIGTGIYTVHCTDGNTTK